MNTLQVHQDNVIYSSVVAFMANSQRTKDKLLQMEAHDKCDTKKIQGMNDLFQFNDDLNHTTLHFKKVCAPIIFTNYKHI